MAVARPRARTRWNGPGKSRDYGVRCILPTSKATDGARTGFDLPLIRLIASATQADVVASGGAGTLEHFSRSRRGGCDGAAAASVFHFGLIRIPELKQYLRNCGFSFSSSSQG